MVNLHHNSILQRVLNNIYILFLIVVFILIGQLLYLTQNQIVRYIYSNTFLCILQRIFINISLHATHVFVYILYIYQNFP